MRAAHQRRRLMSLQPATTTASPPGAGRPVVVTLTEMPPPAASQYEMHLMTASSRPCAPARTSAFSPARHRASSLAVSAAAAADSSTRSTMMLIIVVGVFLLVEVPLSSKCRRAPGRGSKSRDPVEVPLSSKCRRAPGRGSKSRDPVEVPLSILLLLVIVENTFQADLFSDTTRYTAALFVNCCIAITYPLNFFVYCTMSERFRHMFCALFTGRPQIFNNAPPQPPAHNTSARRATRTDRD